MHCAFWRGNQNANAQLLAERRINEYVRRDVDNLRNSLVQISKAINTAADKRIGGENWNLMGIMFNRAVKGCEIYLGRDRRLIDNRGCSAASSRGLRLPKINPSAI